jgi:hypothetical protein
MCLGVNKECAENRDERKTYPAQTVQEETIN